MEEEEEQEIPQARSPTPESKNKAHPLGKLKAKGQAKPKPKAKDPAKKMVACGKQHPRTKDEPSESDNLQKLMEEARKAAAAAEAAHGKLQAAQKGTKPEKRKILKSREEPLIPKAMASGIAQAAT